MGVPGFLGGVLGFLGVFLVFCVVFRVLGGVPGFLGVPGFSGMFRCSRVPVFVEVLHAFSFFTLLDAG